MAKIIVGTDMDNSGFEKKYNKLKNQIEKDNLNLNVEVDEYEQARSEIEKTGVSLEEIEKELDKIDARIRKLYSGTTTETNYNEKLIIATTNLTEKEKEEIDLLHEREQLLVKMRELLTPVETQTEEIKQNNIDVKEQMAEALRHIDQWEDGTYKLADGTVLVNKNYQEVNESMQQVEEATKRIANLNFQQINTALKRTVKKCVQWGLAIFGVRSAYMFVRNAINMITQQDKQLKYDIQVIKTALAYTIEPIIRRIIDLAKTLIGYLAYIIKAWSGGKRDIFASASENLASANSSAKELEKTTASFDKFNKLGSSKGGGGGAGGTTKLNMPTDQEMEGTWVGWIAKNGKKVKAILLGIGIAILAIKLGLAPVPAIILGIATAIVAYLISKYDEIVEWFDKFLDWLKGPFKDKIKKDWGLVGAVFVDVIIGAVTFIKSLFESIIGGIKKIVEGIIDIFKGDFKTGLKKVFSGFADIILAPFKAIYQAVDSVITQIFKALGLIKELNSYMGGGNGSFGGGGSGGARAKGGIYYPNMPKLALGGIVNMPGRGVAYHGAKIGERGAEAVVPLTDTAQMELLGATIGKYVSVNADITLEIESRILAKVMQEINSNNQFMRNGG